VNGDGVVDSADAQAIMNVLPSNFLSGGSVPIGDASYDVRLDINQDRKIDFFGDYGTAYNNDGLTSPPSGWISDPKAPQTSTGLGPDNPIGYTGHVFDPETGLYLARFRHYSPEMGRWMQRDPEEYIDGPNLYQYVSSRPLALNDPLGLCGDDKRQQILNAMKKRGCISAGNGNGNGGGGDGDGPGLSGHLGFGLPTLVEGAGTAGGAAWGAVPEIILYNDTEEHLLHYMVDQTIFKRQAAAFARNAGRAASGIGILFTAYDTYNAFRTGDSLEGTGTALAGLGGVGIGAGIGAMVGGPPGFLAGAAVGLITTYGVPVAQDWLAEEGYGAQTEDEFAKQMKDETCTWVTLQPSPAPGS